MKRHRGSLTPNSCSRRSARTVAALLAGFGILTSGRGASAASYDIAIDASNSPSGNPRFWSTAVGVGTASLTLRADLQTQYKLANRELGMQRVRGHGVLKDDMGIFQWTGGTATPTYDWTKLDTYLAAIAAAGMRPMMELSFMPTALAKSGNDKDPAKDLAVYTKYIQAVVQHCIDKYGAADVGKWYWEVWNEPNYAGFWNGTQADYFAMYDAAVAGATAALPNIMIGGPVTTQGSASYISQFLAHTKSAGVRVSFVTSHAYPGGSGPSADASFGVSDNDGRVSAITGAGYTLAMMPSMNTEWNSAYTGQGGNTTDNNVSMDNHVNAPFIIKSVKLLADQNKGDVPPLEVFSYWALSDIFDESSGPSGSYILSKGGNLPFGSVFGMMTFQGVRKAAWNGFKMLSYLGNKRLAATGGTGKADGVDAFATISSAGDEVAIILYNYYKTVATTGSDTVNLTVSKLPFTGQQIYLTQFAVDSTHSNPYSVWQSQGSPTNPTEVQWQAMKAAQHLMPTTPVTQIAGSGTYSAMVTLPKQGATMIILGKSRPVTGRNGLVEIESEDYDGQSGITKEDSKDAVSLGQSITGASGAYVFYDNVDLSDGGVRSVDLRVNAQSAGSIELHADTQTGPLIGTCSVSATSGAWATQSCMLTPTTGVHNLYVVFGASVHLNSMKFQPSTSTGPGGMGGAAGTSGSAGGAPGATAGATNAGGGASSTAGGTSSGGALGVAGTVAVGAGGALGAGGTTGAAGTPGSGGGTSTTPPVKEASPSGCSCAVVGDSGGERFGATLLVGFGLALLGLRRRKAGQHAR